MKKIWLLTIFTFLSVAKTYSSNKHFDLLVIHSDPQSFPAVGLFNQGIKQYFSAKYLDVHIHYENFNSSIAGDKESYNQHFTELLSIKYLNDMPDAIICVEKDVVEWLIDYAPPSCKAIPIFYIGGIFDLKHVPDHFYKIEVKYDVTDCINTIMQVMPNTKHIYYVIDKYSRERLENEIDFSGFDVDIKFVEGETVSNIIKTLNQSPPNSVIYYQSIYNTGKKDVVPFDVLEAINQNTHIPIFVTMTHFINKNVVGGNCYALDSVGYQSAACIDSVLMSQISERSHFQLNCASHVFNDKALDKFNIATKHLPPNSTIINREKTIWDYWIPISAFLTLAIFEAISIIILLWQRRKMKMAELQIHQINKELESKIDEQVAKIKAQNIRLKDKHKRISLLQKHKELISNMIIHDLKNPLSVILNYQNIANEQLREELVQGAGKNMLNLISNIMDVYKFENHENMLKKECICLTSLIEESFNEISILAKSHHIQINADLDYDINIVADKTILKRVLINLLSNAIKNSPANSKIIIHSQLNEKHKKVKVIVTDNGPGIPDIYMDTLFIMPKEVDSTEVFSSGLGLSFCRMAISAHKGEIGVYNEEHGASFWFELEYDKIIYQPYCNSVGITSKETTNEFPLIIDQNLLNELKKLKVFQITEIESLICKINHKEEQQLTLFISQIKSAIRLCDEDLYNTTIHELEERIKLQDTYC